MKPECVVEVLIGSYGSRERLDEAAKRSLSRIMHHVKNNHVAIISSQRKEETDNNERHHSLIDHLGKSGYGYIHVVGVGQENDKHGRVKRDVTKRRPSRRPLRAHPRYPTPPPIVRVGSLLRCGTDN